MESTVQPQAQVVASTPMIESPEGMKNTKSPLAAEIMHGVSLATLLITFGLLFASIAQAAYGF